MARDSVSPVYKILNCLIKENISTLSDWDIYAFPGSRCTLQLDWHFFFLQNLDHIIEYVKLENQRLSRYFTVYPESYWKLAELSSLACFFLDVPLQRAHRELGFHIWTKETLNVFNRPGVAGAVLQTPPWLIAKLQIKPKSKSNQTKDLERLYIWVVVRLLFATLYNRLIPF